MKSSVSTSTLSLALLVITLSSTSFLPLSQSKTLINQTKTNNNVDLIAQTCARTPSYALCVSTLRSSPEGSSANLAGLALIMVGSVKAKAKETLGHIDDLLKDIDHDDKDHDHNKLMREALSSCGDNYKAVVEGDVPEAVEAIKSGDYKFAEQGMSDAAREADLCEGGLVLAGNSPITVSNKALHDVAAIASSMARMLMTG